MNPARLEKSLCILRDLNRARMLRMPKEVSLYEAILKQHDYDAKDKIDPRQLSIYDTIPGK